MGRNFSFVNHRDTYLYPFILSAAKRSLINSPQIPTAISGYYSQSKLLHYYCDCFGIALRRELFMQY